MHPEDALLFIIQCLRQEHVGCNAHGYDIYVPYVTRTFLNARGREVEYNSREHREASSIFYDAAWELSRRGIIRPGVREMGLQATDDGSAGAGFSITSFGRIWLAEPEHDVFVPTEPERFGRLLEPYRIRFGQGFHERAQEAIRCYGAHAYLACCAMCGAAAESSVLSIAVTKAADEEKVLSIYKSANGRSRIENDLVGKVDERIRREFRALTTLLKYWRDASAHGQNSNIGANEAYTSIAMLLRLASFLNDEWDQIIGRCG